MKPKTPSIVGESALVIAVLNFLLAYQTVYLPYSAIATLTLGILFLIDWMLGGISDKGICRNCF